MTTDVPPRVEAHVRLFNRAVREGDYTDFLATFAADALMRFSGVPAGPFHGRDAIARAYAEQPPDDTMRVLSCRVDGGRDVVRFAWDDGGQGHLALSWRDGQVTRLDVAFDPHELPGE